MLLSGGNAKSGQNIQVVRTMLGQQSAGKPGQATILISQSGLPENAVLSAGQIIQNSAKTNSKGAKNTQKTKGQAAAPGTVYARIIAPPPGMKLASGQTVQGQNVGMYQTVNKILSQAAVTSSVTTGGTISGGHIINVTQAEPSANTVVATQEPAS